MWWGKWGTKYREGSGGRFKQNILCVQMKSLKNKFLIFFMKCLHFSFNFGDIVVLVITVLVYNFGLSEFGIHIFSLFCLSGFIPFFFKYDTWTLQEGLRKGNKVQKVLLVRILVQEIFGLHTYAYAWEIRILYLLLEAEWAGLLEQNSWELQVDLVLIFVVPGQSRWP